MQGVENGLVDLAASQVSAAGAADEIEAFRPQAALLQFVVEQFEQGAYTFCLTQANQPSGDGQECIDRDLSLDRGQPLCLNCVDVTAGEAVLYAWRDPHAAAGGPGRGRG